MKKLVSLALCFILAFGLVACQPAATPEPPQVTPPPATPAPTAEIPTKYTPGTYTGTAMGFADIVTVTITVDDNAITEIQAEGPGETAGIGTLALEKLPEQIKQAGSAEIDGVSGATMTSAAVLKAAGDALAQAAGAAEAVAKMKPGTYTGQGMGYSLIDPIVVDVTVSESAIESIRVTAAPRETSPIFKTAEELMIPRMIAHQSLYVDAITGATASSNGIRAAVTQAVAEALAAGGSEAAAISAFQTIPAKSTAKETIDVDVLVVGMGGAGCAAALSAAEAAQAAGGGKVLAIDKTGKFGGTSANCAEPMAVNAPRYKEKFNNGEDYMDGAAMKKAWMDFVQNGNKEEMLDLFLDNSGDTIDWLFFEHGFTFNNPTTGFTAADVYRCKYQFTFINNAEEGRDYGIELKYRNEQVDEYFHNMMDDYRELGGEIMLETEATELLYDAAGNKITGVKATKSDGTEVTINAKAVILATGGFAGSPELEEKYFTNDYWPIKGGWGTFGWGMSHNDGKMIDAAINLGAGTYNIDMPPMVHFVTTASYITDYPVHPAEGPASFWYGHPATWSLNDVPLSMGIASDTLQVDNTGRRYANEDELFVWWKAGPTFKTIWSDAQLEKVMTDGFTYPGFAFAQSQGGVPAGMPIPEIREIMDKAIAKGYVHKANTLDELAALTGMDAAKLKESVSTYNEMCRKGEDTQYGKNPQYLWDLGDEGPYYAIDCASVVYSTCGGLDVNTKLEVLQKDGQTPIAGLYAVGNDSGGVLYTNKREYVTFGGAALGWAFTSGRLSGINAMAYVNEQ